MVKSPLEENLFGNNTEKYPNADILNDLFRSDDLGNTCIFRVDGKTAISVQSNTCHGIIDVRRLKPDATEKCDPNEDPTCNI